MGLKQSTSKTGPNEADRIATTPDLHDLLVQLKSLDPAARRRAARHLATFSQSVPALGQALLTEQDPSVRSTLFTSLAGFATDESVTALVPLLRSEDAALRNGAIEALTGMPQAVAPTIGKLLRDPDPDVRIFTVNLLADLRHDMVGQWLRQVLKEDASVNVVAAAIEVMTEVGDTRDIPFLRAAAQRLLNEPFIGFAVAMAIERIEAP